MPGDSLRSGRRDGEHHKGVTALLIALFSVSVIALAAFALWRGRRSDEARRQPGDGSNGDDGGSQPRIPPRMPSGPPDCLEPDWWSQFERDLAQYTRQAGSRT